MAKRKVYRITFGDRTDAGLFLYELRMWGVRETRYTVNKFSFTTKDPNVVDVCTESFPATRFTIEQLQDKPTPLL